MEECPYGLHALKGLRLRSSNRNPGPWRDIFRLRTERDGGHASEGNGLQNINPQQPSHSPTPKRELRGGGGGEGT